MKKLIPTILVLLFNVNLFASSALYIKNNVMFFGKNFDWSSGEGMLIKNNRNTRKTAYGLDNSNLASWTSKFGSVTFNQFGKEFPYGGMNERGLVVEMLQLPNTRYKESDQPSLTELEWIQYQLDNFKTVPEVEYNLDSLTINPLNSHLHFLIADAQGRSAVIEFINGEAKAFKTNEDFQALTNTLYEESEQYFQNNQNSIDNQSKSSLNRYAQLKQKALTSGARSVKGMFNIMEGRSVATEGYKTQWTIIYDLKTLAIHFKSAGNAEVKSLEIKALDLSSNAPILFMDIDKSFIEFDFFTAQQNNVYLQAFFVNDKVKVNKEQVKQHALNPSEKIIDEVYSKNYKDLSVTFNIKKNQGLIYYTLIKERGNFSSLNGYKSGMANAEAGTLKVYFYSVPYDEYVVAAFHDLDKNGELSKGMFGIPNEPYALSNNKKGLFGLPKYDRASFNLSEKSQLTINIK